MSTLKAIVLKGGVHLKNDGTTNVKIRITHKKKIAYISTDLYVIPDQFDNKTGGPRPGAINESFIRLRILNILRQYSEKDIELGDRREYMSVADVKKYMLEGKSTSKQIDFFEFINSFIQNVKTEGTRNQYIYTRDSLKNFVGEKLPVSEITLNFLFRYEAWLRSNGTQNGIINYMTTFRSLFNKCRDYYNNEDMNQILIPQYPFKRYKMPKRIVRTKQNNLTIEELQKFINYKPETPREQYAKDMFLLMIYLIGIEAKDLFYLDKDRDGRIIYDRFKTGKDFSIKVEPEAQAIINKYSETEKLISASERFMHHKSFYREINNHLKGEKAHKIKGIFPKLGIKKPVTSKWARHTWATIARNRCNISKADVALCLGHEDQSNRVTDIYIEYDYSIIDKSNRHVIDVITTLPKF